MNPRSPDFICIGAQKAGTSWLRENLRTHPGVWMPPLRELHYFDEELEGMVSPPRLALARAGNESWREKAIAHLQRLAAAGDTEGAAWWAVYYFLDRNDAWYRSLFAFAPENSITGDITPSYMLGGAREVDHIHQIAPRAKLLFLLRHPVERFWSQCRMKYANNTLELGEAAAMRLLDTSNGRPRGIYSEAILRFCEKFDPERMLLVFHEGIRRQPREVMREVFAFLGLPDILPDETTLTTPVNQSPSRDPIPPGLQGRVGATYRSEIRLLSEVFGGHATGWLNNVAMEGASPVVRLTPDHVEQLKTRLRLRRSRPLESGKIFCVSIQRSGTTTVGDWLEAHGLPRAGTPTAIRKGWTRLWMLGNYEAIFSSEEFRHTLVFDDDPWWCPDFFRVLARRFPDARFILVERDEDAWFDSLCRHSGGRNPGCSDVHSRVYQREDELEALLRHEPNLQREAWGLLKITEHREHYKSVYRRHGEAVRSFFADQSHRLLCGRLEDPGVFARILDFAGLEDDPGIAVPHSNASANFPPRTLEAMQQTVIR